jgi:outer membrane protein TolC
MIARNQTLAFFKKPETLFLLELIAFLIVFLWTNPSPAEDRLQLDQYLSQVKTNHAGAKGSLIATQAGVLRSNEGELLLAPTIFGEAKYTSDAKLPQINFVPYDSITTRFYSFGVRKLTTFGLQASLRYDILDSNYNNPDLSGLSSFGGGGTGSSPFNFSYALASPILELTQSLWANGFGGSTRATQEQLQATAIATSYQSSYQLKSIVVQGEVAYWRLALARQVIQVEAEALDRAEKIYAWNSRRARLHLGDEADVIQSEALVQARKLELMTAKTETRLASRDFNSMRTIDSDEVKEELIALKPELVDRIQIPQRAALRDDVLAAKESARASTASAEIALQRDLPTLEAYTVLALNGQSGNRPASSLSDSISNSFSLNRPTTTVGIRFNAPLDLGVLSKSRDGWRQEQVAADLNFSRKVYEQEQNWKQLNESLEQTIGQYKLALKLEDVQKSKLNNERGRLQRGRSTTYQVLLFEQDYLQAQLTRIQNEAKILNILAQMKLFGETV